MGLLDTANLAYSRFSYGNYSYTPSSYAFAYSTPSYSSYPLLFNNYGYRNFAPSAYSPKMDFSPKTYSYGSFAPSSYSAAKYSGGKAKFGSLTFPRSTGSLQTDLVNNSLSWVGKVNSDRGRQQIILQWCKSSLVCRFCYFQH